jgi:N-acetylglucosaminyldiphosphoundecaprenol N-acetyl-beta-D-mannosaminyltransferase
VSVRGWAEVKPEKSSQQRVDILGVEVSAINPGMASDTIAAWIDSDAREYVCVRDVHGVVASLDDPELRMIHNRAGMVTPDGMPLVWVGRRAGADWMRRVYGPDLLLSVCEKSSEQGWSHFFYGAAEGVPDELAGRLADRYPGLKVVGTFSPPYRQLTADEVVETADMINSSGADIVWVGLSSPKQERWMAQFRPLLEARVMIGIGAAFDIHAGNVPQAPRWMQRSGFEWFFRLIIEPRRLWRRYLVSIPRFLWRILLQKPRLVSKAPASRE